MSVAVVTVDRSTLSRLTGSAGGPLTSARNWGGLMSAMSFSVASYGFDIASVLPARLGSAGLLLDRHQAQADGQRVAEHLALLVAVQLGDLLDHLHPVL